MRGLERPGRGLDLSREGFTRVSRKVHIEAEPVTAAVLQGRKPKALAGKAVSGKAAIKQVSARAGAGAVRRSRKREANGVQLDLIDWIAAQTAAM